MKIEKEILKLIRNANYIYIIGNGGSASTANHMANDLVKLCGLKAISLCANEAVVMAYANDNGYGNVFSDQLKVFFKEGDILITISGSGTSKNIVKAQKYVNSHKGDCVVFPTMKILNCDMQKIEDIHLQLVHRIAKKLMK